MKPAQTVYKTLIPKIIHHVWPGDDVFKSKYFDFRLSWMKFHPDWTFYFWRLDNLPQNMDQRVLDIANNPKYSVVVKSDIIRFEILRLMGGLYVDTDMECLYKFDPFMNYAFFTGYEDDCENICPSLIGCIPNHTVIKDVVEESLNTINQHTILECNKDPAHNSGVIPFAHTVKRNLNSVKVFPKEYFYPVHFLKREELKTNKDFCYSKHHWTGMDPDGWTNAKYDE